MVDYDSFNKSFSSSYKFIYLNLKNYCSQKCEEIDPSHLNVYEDVKESKFIWSQCEIANSGPKQTVLNLSHF